MNVDHDHPIDLVIDCMGFTMNSSQIQAAGIIKRHLIQELTTLGYYCPDNHPNHVFLVYQNNYDGDAYVTHVFIDPAAIVLRKVLDKTTTLKIGKIDIADPECFAKIIALIQETGTPTYCPIRGIENVLNTSSSPKISIQ